MTPLEGIVGRIDTRPLQQEAPTRALVVFNTTEVCRAGRVRFAATFPMRAEKCPQPVLVRDAEGTVLPSRLTRSDVSVAPHLPPGRVLWAMELEFVIPALPGRSYQTFAAAFDVCIVSLAEERALFDAAALLPFPVIETECRSGDLPLAGLLDGLQ
jgi:hypothetical protein